MIHSLTHESLQLDHEQTQHAHDTETTHDRNVAMNRLLQHTAARTHHSQAATARQTHPPAPHAATRLSITQPHQVAAATATGTAVRKSPVGGPDPTPPDDPTLVNQMQYLQHVVKTTKLLHPHRSVKHPGVRIPKAERLALHAAHLKYVAAIKAYDVALKAWLKLVKERIALIKKLRSLEHLLAKRAHKAAS